jgi:hypothetical protein
MRRSDGCPFLSLEVNVNLATLDFTEAGPNTLSQNRLSPSIDT